MPYATQQNLIDRFGESELLALADRDNNDVVEAAIVDDAIGDADRIIDGYISARYDLPLSSTPEILTAFACDIARYRLHIDSPPDVVRDRYKDAIKGLMDISAGKASLDVDGKEADAKPGGIAISSSSPLFGRDAMKGF